ncbi:MULTISPECIES: hypothetical protein [unclassified Mesorhizobium]|uniref:hypothetical protein n=1 Tax=unclassified Mesorhizobium TaxID=325217 RepID=UPI000FCB3D46|nr:MULTISPECIES: hypothetical protein [unclassified Mesorhizobium]TGP20236.1 hypothetical protein EN874_025995 [Mesorhizobium sp. M1D.F.Ca.ET.231.01.1.1]TGP27713.1 hypothetical protein EN877_25285 [Mesorhizobium sp. M1D.F.Ca.ET.234.01.1.1]TGS42063.1 hypothetical protein EN827_24370 [Mesorhizobium sp. M1D.F.Ca.ET.184.01.1.1]TGS59415.1 hypothetical protein EN826_024370 [Mesorhizobium sp. M1D.F.Ca.ET.183.01.1.1]
MHINAEAPFPPAQLAREEMLRFLSTGFGGPCCGESNEMLAYLEGVASSEKAAVTEPPRPRSRLRGLFSGLHLFPA